VYKNDVDKLKTRNTTLHTLIEAILNSSEDDVPSLIKEIRTCADLDAVADRLVARKNGSVDSNENDDDYPPPMGEIPSQESTFEKQLYGKMGRLRLDEGSVRYFGGTSNLIQFGHGDEDTSSSIGGISEVSDINPITSWTNVTDDADLIAHLLNMYFTWHYPSFVCLSKTLFYDEFHRGRSAQTTNRARTYCSPVLVNAMLALGCHFTTLPTARDNPNDSATAGDHFFREAKRLIMENDEHEKPCLATVQAFGLMSVREAGCGREAKGWVYSGMAFRMACDMGLNIDSSQLSSDRLTGDHEIEDDARRITFWGCFLFDKYWSNYMGRLPQIPTSHATVSLFDVFPDEDSAPWRPYTDSGFTQAYTQPARTRAVALEMIKLCQISNDLMKNFYDPADMDKAKGKASELKKLSDIHTRLESWRRELPKELEPREGGLSHVLIMQ
jgi:hypothetical protein